MSSNRKWIYRLVTTAFAFAVVLVIMEIGFRIHYVRRDALIRNGCRILRSHTYASICEPNTQGRHITREFNVNLQVNDEGYRENLHSLTNPGSIVLLGDSFVWGTGVEEHQRFGNLISAWLTPDVLNYGLCGAGTINELATFVHFAESKDPSMVILVFVPNDTQNNLEWLNLIDATRAEDTGAMVASIDSSRDSIKPIWPDEDNLSGRQIRFSALWYFASTRLTEINASRALRPTRTVPIADGRTAEVDEEMIQGKSAFTAFLRGSSPMTDLSWTLTRTALSALKARCDTRSIPLLTVYLPLRESITPELWAQSKERTGIVVPDELIDFEKPGRMFKAIVDDLGIDHLDVTPQLRGFAEKLDVPMYYEYDSHLTVKGNAAVADTIAEHLRQHYPNLLMEDS